MCIAIISLWYRFRLDTSWLRQREFLLSFSFCEIFPRFLSSAFRSTVSRVTGFGEPDRSSISTFLFFYFLPNKRNRIDLFSHLLKRDERIRWILSPRKSFFTSGKREREKMKTRTISHANHDARPGSVKTSYLERFRSAARDRDFHESRYTCPYSGGGFQWPRLNPRRYHWTAQMRRDSKRYQGSCHVEHVHPMHNHA